MTPNCPPMRMRIEYERTLYSFSQPPRSFSENLSDYRHRVADEENEQKLWLSFVVLGLSLACVGRARTWMEVGTVWEWIIIAGRKIVIIKRSEGVNDNRVMRIPFYVRFY